MHAYMSEWMNDGEICVKVACMHACMHAWMMVKVFFLRQLHWKPNFPVLFVFSFKERGAINSLLLLSEVSKYIKVLHHFISCDCRYFTAVYSFTSDGVRPNHPAVKMNCLSS